MTPKPILASCVCGVPNCQIPYGYCHCGCGGETTISKRTVKSRGLRAGFPYRYIVFHIFRVIPLSHPTHGQCANGRRSSEFSAWAKGKTLIFMM